MSKKKIAILFFLILFLAAGFLVFKFFSVEKISNAKISGTYFGNQTWSGEIIITGDTIVLGNLTVLPNTIIKFVVGDDRGWGDEVEKDGFNDNDPTRLKSYTTTHSSLFVLQKLMAQGTKDKQIVFTSKAQKPYLADWEAIVWQGDGSVLDNVVVEYTRNGLNPIGKQPNSVIQNSISRHSMWGAISSANSNIKIINNHLSDAGHEGIDLKSNGSQEVAGNTIDDCHTGIASMAGTQLIKNNIITNCGDGVYIDSKSNAISTNNTFVPALAESQRVWRYGSYEIPIFDA